MLELLTSGISEASGVSTHIRFSYNFNSLHFRVYEDRRAFRFPLAKMNAGSLTMDIFIYSLNKTMDNDNSSKIPARSKRGSLQFGEVFPLKRCKFLGVDTRCPCNPRATFKMLYNGDMRPLKVCKQGRWVNRKKGSFRRTR